MQIVEPHAPITATTRAHQGRRLPNEGPSNLRTRERFTLLFGVEVAPTVEDSIGSHILPTYVWSEHIIFNMLSPTIQDISQVMILNPMECLVF